MRFVCVSDTHRHRWNLSIPKGDVFIFAGDAGLNKWSDIIDFNLWANCIPCKHKLFIAGNHDGGVFYNSHQIKGLLSNWVYLENDVIEIEGIKLFGSPYSKEFNNWFFMKDENGLNEIWKTIPEDIDIVVTHGPAYGWLDQNVDCENCGSKTLKIRLEEIKPKYHITGHLHEASGVLQTEHTTVINCSVLDEKYNLTFEPKVFDFEK